MPETDRSLLELWPLTANFEYAAEAGLELRRMRPGWWAEFTAEMPVRERFVLGQAQGMAFLAWLEERFEGTENVVELIDALERALRDGAPRLRAELRASRACIGRDYTERAASSTSLELAGEPVSLYAPEACRGYPAGKAAQLDEWTAEALTGAEVAMVDSTPAAERELRAAHDSRYLNGLFEFAGEGGGLLTPETLVTPEAEVAVRAGAGALIQASRRALAGDPGPHLCQVHPGSHHAERFRAGGSCLVNNLAVAAEWALRHGARSVGIVDLDAHHGNGSEQIFRERPEVFTLSLHQAGPFFPGTGARDEIGRGKGRGSNLNLPVKPGSDWLGYLEMGLSQLARHRPQLVLVEFSTDAHESDPVSDLAVTDADYREAVQMIYGLRCPVVFELGASLSRRAWIGGVRALVQAAAAAGARSAPSAA